LRQLFFEGKLLWGFASSGQILSRLVFQRVATFKASTLFPHTVIDSSAAKTKTIQSTGKAGIVAVFIGEVELTK